MSFFEFPHTRTYDTDLGRLIEHVASYDEVITALNEWIATNTPKIEDLEAFKEALESGDLPEGVKNGIMVWCQENLIDLVGETIKNVFFGLTDSGNFVAYIPDSWSDITFNTNLYDYVLVDHPEIGYGHLILSY